MGTGTTTHTRHKATPERADVLSVLDMSPDDVARGDARALFKRTHGFAAPRKHSVERVNHELKLLRRAWGARSLTPKLRNGLKDLLCSNWQPGETRFRGNAFTEYLGIMYLLHRHTRDCSPLLFSRMIALDERDVAFSDFEVAYTRGGKVVLPPDFRDTFQACVDEGARFVFLMLDVPGHSNCLVHDTARSSMERFDPYGGRLVSDGGLAPRVNDKVLCAALRRAGVKFDRYLRPTDYMDLGVQYAEETERKGARRQGDPRGFCAAWSLWYLHILLARADDVPLDIPPEAARDKVLQLAHAIMRESGRTYREFIRSFSIFISKEVGQLRAMTPRQRVAHIQAARRAANCRGPSPRK